jgi:hypothetical protein
MREKALHIAAVTANCGNDTLGKTSCDALLASLKKEDGPAVLIVHCQEVHFTQQKKQFERALSGPLECIAAPLMRTHTKLSWEVICGNTGITSFVLYNKNKIKSLQFIPPAAEMLRGGNNNKGGYLNTLEISDHNNEHYQLRLISAHLDSNSDKRRQTDWQNIKKHNAFEASSWQDLCRQVPLLQVAGYDANVRDAWDRKQRRAYSLWQEEKIDSRIASLVFAPLGSEHYSRANTYGQYRGTARPDPHRPGYARQGALDFLTIQDNTHAAPTATSRYQEAPLCYPTNAAETKRDHDIIGVEHIRLHKTEPFERVKHYISSELSKAAPRMAEEIETLKDSAENRARLLRIHHHYLSPHGALIAKITLSNTSPWFAEHDLAQEELMHQFCQKFKKKFIKTNSDGIKDIIRLMDKPNCIDLTELGEAMHRIAKGRRKSWYSKSHVFGPGRSLLVQSLYDALARMDFSKSTPEKLQEHYERLLEVLEGKSFSAERSSPK